MANSEPPNHSSPNQHGNRPSGYYEPLFRTNRALGGLLDVFRVPNGSDLANGSTTASTVFSVSEPNKSVVTYDVDAGRRDSRSAPQRRQFRIRTNQERTGQLSWPAWLTQNQRQPTVTFHSPSPRFSACALLWTQHADGGRRLDIPNHSWQALQRYQPPAPASQASREKRRCCKRRALLMKDAQAQLGHSKMSKRRWIERQLTLHRQPTRRDRN